MRKETIALDTSVTSTNGDRKIMKPIGIMRPTPPGIRNWNQFNQFKRTYTKVTSLEKT